MTLRAPGRTTDGRSKYQLESSREAGFTLTELVVVTALIAVVAAIAVVEGRAKVNVAAQMGTLQSLVGDAANLAVSRGPMLPDLVLAEDGGLALDQRGARTRLRFTPGDPVWVSLELRVEDAGGTATTWQPVAQRSLDRRMVVASTDSAANTAAELAPAAISPAPGTDFSTEILINCYPDGRCDQFTLYAHRTDSPPAPHRLVVTYVGDASVIANW